MAAPEVELDLEGLLDEAPAAPAEEGDGEELPPGFMSAFEEYEAAEGSEERARAFYRAIEACKGA